MYLKRVEPLQFICFLLPIRDSRLRMMHLLKQDLVSFLFSLYSFLNSFFYIYSFMDDHDLDAMAQLILGAIL